MNNPPIKTRPKAEVYPLYWHCKRNDNDIAWIMPRMRIIPDNKKEAVARRYERIFRSGKLGSRKRANTFLHRIASAYKAKAATSSLRKVTNK